VTRKGALKTAEDVGAYKQMQFHYLKHFETLTVHEIRNKTYIVLQILKIHIKLLFCIVPIYNNGIK